MKRKKYEELVTEGAGEMAQQISTPAAALPKALILVSASPGSIQPSVTLVLENLMPPLNSLSTKHAYNMQTFMWIKNNIHS